MNVIGDILCVYVTLAVFAIVIICIFMDAITWPEGIGSERRFLLVVGAVFWPSFVIGAVLWALLFVARGFVQIFRYAYPKSKLDPDFPKAQVRK